MFLDVFGASGHLMDLFLRDNGDTFNEGQEDVFFFPSPLLGELSSVCISHDDSGGCGCKGHTQSLGPDLSQSQNSTRTASAQHMCWEQGGLISRI